MKTTCRECGKTFGGRAEHCAVCHEVFTSRTAGDMHRVGDHGVFEGPDRRRCLSVVEMGARGMVLNGRGQWMSGESDRFVGPPVGSVAVFCGDSTWHEPHGEQDPSGIRFQSWWCPGSATAVDRPL